MKGWGPKSSVCPSKPKVTKLFGGTSRNICRDIPEVPEKFEKNKVVFISGLQRGRRKGATSKNVENRQEVSKSFSTLFDNFRAEQKKKNVKNRQEVSKSFSTPFDNFRAGQKFSGPFWGALISIFVH